ncbi:alpha/beta-hydrolase family protein [Cereibacter sp. SYSU M97828]|nr:alpha/beta-hydrolase family protein [Cereibacter flavus]
MSSGQGLFSSLVRRISGMGLIVGTFFMAMSLTPSLIPRSDLVQGVLAGVCFAVGYGITLLAKSIWLYIQLPTPNEWLSRRLFILSGSLSVATALSFFVKAAEWQNSIRAAMGIDPVPTSLPVAVGTIAAGIAIILVGSGKLIAILWRRISRRLGRYIRPRLARIIGLALVIWGIALVGNGLVFRGLLRVADSSAQALDALVEPDVAPPTDPLRTGSAASLISWEDLGREGRNFIGNPVGADRIRQITGLEAIDPIRVYVGLNAAEEATDRAALAVAELDRIGGFGRGRLVIAMPTGTGWMDPAAFETLEYLQRGDVATVAIQYSYLQSWLSLIVEPDYSIEAGRALFSAVYARWKELPEAERPELFLYGLSLGAYSSQQSMRLHEIIDDPVSGALWVGPPFVSPLWQTLTAERDPGSPAWLPRVDQGQLVRFTNGSAGLDAAGRWGRMRIVYLQYASDPIVFFKTDGAFRKPDWMAEPRGPDVSSELRWYPIVSFLQQAFDMAIALAVPMGHGHLYSYTDHIGPWMQVMPPEDLDPASLARLERYLKTRND